MERRHPKTEKPIDILNKVCYNIKIDPGKFKLLVYFTMEGKKMKQLSDRLLKLVVFLKDITLIMIMGACMLLVMYYEIYGWPIIIISVIWLAAITFGDIYMPLIWARCYYELAVIQALNHGTPMFEQLQNITKIDIIQPNRKALTFSVAVFVASFLPVIGLVSMVISAVSSLAYLGIMTYVGLRYLWAYRYNVKHQDEYVPACRAESIYQNEAGNYAIQCQLISVAELHQTFSEASRKARGRL